MFLSQPPHPLVDSHGHQFSGLRILLQTVAYSCDHEGSRLAGTFFINDLFCHQVIDGIQTVDIRCGNCIQCLNMSKESFHFRHSGAVWFDRRIYPEHFDVTVFVSLIFEKSVDQLIKRFEFVRTKIIYLLLLLDSSEYQTQILVNIRCGEHVAEMTKGRLNAVLNSGYIDSNAHTYGVDVPLILQRMIYVV